MAKVRKSSGNIFEDLNLRDAPELQLKAELTRQVYKIVKKLKLTQSEVAELSGLRQPDVSKLVSGQYSGFSTDRLLDLLNALNYDVSIVIKPKPRSRNCANIKVRMGAGG